MKKTFLTSIICILSLIVTSCVSMPTEKNRDLIISGYSDFGGCERWYAIDKYNYDEFIEEVRFQVGYFNSNNIGFVLYEDGIIGEVANFSRQGLDLRWDWGDYERDGSSRYRYSFVIQPDGTGFYYDFSISENGVAKPRDIYKCKKF